MNVRIWLPGMELQFRASHEPCDSLYRLAKCLTLGLMGIERSVFFATESDEYEFTFRPETEIGTLRLDLVKFPDSRRLGEQGEPLASVVMPSGALCEIFLDALADLGNRFPPRSFHERWKRRFPVEALERLRAIADGARPARQ